MKTMFTFPKTPSKRQTFGQLPGCSLALALATQGAQTPGFKCILTPDHLSAKQLEAELRFFLPQDHTAPILFFPDWETLPYDHFSPHQDLISERLATLHHIQQHPDAWLITAASTAMHRLCPASFLNQHTLYLNEQQFLNLDTFRHQLLEAGYHAVQQVLEHGEFALRGSILDLYPMGSPLPFRIELFDDHIESLRRFDPDTQRTVEKVSHIHLLPARECALDEHSIAQFRRAFREQFSTRHCPLYEAVSAQQLPQGIEYYLPLFFEKTATLFDYLPETTTLYLIEDTHTHATQFFEEVHTRYEQHRHDATRPLLTPATLFLTPDTLMEHVHRHSSIQWFHSTSSKKNAVHFDVEKGSSYPMKRDAEQPLERLVAAMQDLTKRYLLVVETAGRRELLLSWLQQSQIHPVIQDTWRDFLQSTAAINLIIAPLIEGATFNDTLIIVESQLFGEQATPVRRTTSKTIDPDLIIRDLAELHIGAPVVHLQFGIGRYLGLQSFEHAGISNEFLTLAYAGDDKIYVPVTALHLISRYTGSDHPPLHRLGTDQWQKARQKAAENIHDIAIELLELYAKREARPGHSYTVSTADMQRFAQGFPFIETADQTAAIAQIQQDMQAPRPMDRLICGDVGFGKTEVAMRAAFIAVQNGQQVCVVVPTTLLAGQHFETFRDRFAEWPVQIALLSRFRSTKETTQALTGLADGRIDIVIGTHKLFQKDIRFKRLGLLIIDEEHRFGVKQKEHLKTLQNEVDLLSMTATPIPRTLNMAMAGIRDISLITTPPAKRLAIKTFWQERKDTTLREAILREILRGGQVFFLHNQVQTIEHTCQSLQALVPEARIKYAHGQMSERDLERMMSDFYHHRFNVLVCTTIIETGIDIPTANTILIDRADQFGLAQLHQLRGRVGRSHHQAYAYLLTPPKTQLTKDAIKRLDAIVSLEDLGAGFILATHDLEIRGAGELLGEDQSGNMHAIGFTLFMELLDRAVTDLKSGKIPALNAPLQQGPEIDLHLLARIPDDYIQDTHLRLVMYKRISTAKHSEDLHALQVELIDRFGLLPPAVKHLFGLMELKFLATTLGITRIHATTTTGHLEFGEAPQINTHALLQLIQLHAKRYQLDGPTRLKFALTTIDEARIQEVKALLIQLTK